MSGYIELNRTGFAPFDDALSLIEEAGDAYHHTSQWIDDGWTGEKPYLVQINESIEFAAKSYLSLQDENNELRTQLAKAEQRVAEACAKWIDGYAGIHQKEMRSNTAKSFADALRRGEWRKFVKEV